MSNWNYDMDSCPLDTKVYLLSSNDCFLLPQREYVGTITHNGKFKTRGECYSGNPDYFYRSAIVAWKPFEQQMKLAFYLEERMDFGLINCISGTPIIIVPTRKIQNRTHKKKRINKKWAKRYGFTIYERLKNSEIYMMDGKLYMNQHTHEILKKILENSI